MRNTIERRQEITLLTQSKGRVNVEELAKLYSVSTVTIRNDLNILSKNGFVVRSRGGAVASTYLTRELSVHDKYKKHSKGKRALGEAVAQLIQNGDSVILDSGTTVEEVARCLTNHQDLLVTTNGLNIALALAETKSIEVMVTGGTLRKKSFSFYGRHAENGLRHLHIDKVILGADGVDIEAGVTTFFEPEAALNRIMCEVSQEIIAVADSSKFGHRGFHKICALNKLTTIVTDSGLPPEYATELKRIGVDLVIVETRP